MKLTFAATRGEIDLRTGKHRRHSVLVVSQRGFLLMLDCGADWAGRAAELKPRAILLTHAHPDHAWGLRDGAPAAVFATQETWNLIGNWPISQRRLIDPRRPITLGTMTVEAFVEHSIRCPAVAYRVRAGAAAVLYAPDVVYIHDRAEAMRGVRLYVGDGATLKRPMVRQRDSRLIGHTPVRTQLSWCQKEGVRRAVFTHCGSQIVSDHRGPSKRSSRWRKNGASRPGLHTTEWNWSCAGGTGPSKDRSQ